MSKTNQSLAALSGVAMTLFSSIAPSYATEREKVSLRDYCKEQNAGAHKGHLHMQKNPYISDSVPVTLNTKHGPIKINFQCQALVPICDRKQFVFTQAGLGIIDKAMGSYNQNDPAQARKNMRYLSTSFQIVNQEHAESMEGLKHLEEYHDVSPYKLENKILKRTPNGKKIIKECAANLQPPFK